MRRPALCCAAASLALLVAGAGPLAAQGAKPAGPPAMARDTSMADIDTTGGQIVYRREVFHYGGGTRDPFQSLVTSSEVGPSLQDLTLVSIIYDPVYGRSVAVVRESPGNKIIRLRRGETVGRLRVLQIREFDVVFQVEEFGFERQEVLALHRQGEANP